MSAPEAESMVLDFDGWLGQQDPTARQGITEHLNAVPEAARDQEKHRLASMYSVAEATKLDLPTVNEQWDTVRGGFAEKAGGPWLAAKDDEGAFYNQLRAQKSQQRDERHLISGPDDDKAPNAREMRAASLEDATFNAALLGHSAAEAFTAWQKNAAGKPGFDPARADTYFQHAQDLHDQVTQRFSPVLELADQSFNALSTGKDLETASEQLMPQVDQLSDEQRRDFLTALRTMADAAPDKTRATFWGNFTKQAGRDVSGTGRSFMDFLAAAGGAQAIGDAALSEGSGAAPAGFQRDLLQGFGKSLREHNLESDLRRVQETDFSPVRDVLPPAWRWAEKGAYAAPGALAFTAEGMIPGVGLPALFGTMTSQAYESERFRLMDSGMGDAQASQRAAAIAPIVAAPQAALMELRIGALAGKFPALKAALNAIGDKAGGGLLGYGARVAGQAATQLPLMEGMSLMQPTVEAAAAALDRDMPGVNWHDGEHGVLDGFWARQGESFVSLLPLVLLGAASSGSARVESLAKASDLQLQSFGAKAEDITAFRAAVAKGPASALDAAEALVTNRDGNSDAAKAATDELTKQAREAAAASDAGLQSDMKQAGVQKVVRDGDGWALIHDDGTRTQAGSDQAALAIVNDLKQASTQKEAAALVSIIDDWHSKAPADTKRETTLTGETATSTGDAITYTRPGVGVVREVTSPAVIDALREEVRMDSRGNEPVDVLVNGSNTIEFREKVADGATRVVQRLELNQSDSTALTALHEQIESVYRTGIADGTITHEETRAAIASLAAALDPANARTPDERAFRERVQRVAEGKASDTETRETVSELAVADVLGRRKDGESFPAGSVSTILDAAIRNGADPAEAKQLGKFRAFLRSAKTYFRAVLGTVAALKKNRREGGAQDFSKLTDKLLGLSDQRAHEDAVAKDLEKSLPDYVPPSAEEQANGVAFSLKKGEKAGVEPAPFSEENRVSKMKRESAPFKAILRENPAFNPEAKTNRVYRAAIGSDLRVNDYVALNKSIAEEHLQNLKDRGETGTVSSFDVPTDSLLMANDATEFVYHPPDAAGFRLSPGSRLELLQKRIDARLAGDPEARREVARKASDALQKLQFEMETERESQFGTVRPIEERKSKAELDKEQGVRQALRADELTQEGMATLSDSEHRAYDSGLRRLEESPLIGEMLSGHGKLVSASRAEREGKLGEYDGTPWLPPQWYAKKGGLMPDEMAQALHDAGYLREPTPDALWQALASEIQSTRSNNEAWKKAADKVKEFTQKAGEQARAESNAWRTEQDKRQAKDYSPRARLTRDLRTLDAILSALPPELRGKVGGFVKLAQLGSDKARIAEIGRRIDKISGLLETHLQKETLSALDTLLERAQPKGGAGERAGGKIGVEGHRFFDILRAVKDMPEQAVRDRQDVIETRLGQPIDDAERGQLLHEWGMLHAFGDFAEKSAAEMDSGFRAAEEVYRTGRDKWNAVLEQRAQERQALRATAIAEAGSAGGGRARQDARAAEAEGGQRRKLVDFFTNAHLSFAQRLSRIFGTGEITSRYERAVTEAYHGKQTALNEHRTKLRDTLLKAFGEKSWAGAQDKLLALQKPREKSGVFRAEGVKTEQREFPVEVAEKIVDGRMAEDVHGLPPEKVAELSDLLDANAQAEHPHTVLKMDVTTNPGARTEQRISELQAVHLTMLARTEQYRRAMEKHGWDAESLKQLEAMLSPAAREIRAFLSERYEAGYAGMNDVFKPMFGIDLPKVKNYAPGYFEHSGTESEMDPFGSGIDAGGLAAGFLKSRKNHLAEPTVIDALQAFWQHTMQTEHWKAFAPLISEMRSVLGNVDVRHSMEAIGGKRAALDVADWMSHLEQNGAREAQSNAWLARVVTGLTRARLSFNIGTWMKHLPNAFASLADVPAMDWMRGLGRVLTGQSDATLTKIWNSELIRNRIELSFTPDLRQVMAGERARPSKVGDFLDWGVARIPWIASAFTTFSAAIAHDVHLREAHEAGLTGEQAEAHAMRETELTVARTAQPESIDRKSLAELDRKGVGKLAMMFVTPERQQLGMALAAVMNAKEGKISKAEAARVLFSTWVVAPVLMQTMVGLAKYAFTDEDAEEAWNWKRYASAVALGPVSGWFGIGQIAEVAASHFKGEITRAGGSPFVTAAQAIFSGGKGIAQWLHPPEDNRDHELTLKDVEHVGSGLSELLSGFTDIPVEAISVVDRLFRQARAIGPDTEADKERKEKKALAKERKAAR
jgi:hypothetical protein